MALLGGVSARAQVPDGAHPLEISPQEAQETTRLVQAPDGFELDLFAAPPEVNYPTAITATPEGNLFVAVDRNGSLDRERGRGEILKVLDTDDDGQGDHYTSFVDSVDSPRGLVYDGRTLYVVHPPALTAYTDTDGDGVSDTSTTLVEGLGFGLDFRGADHTTNGLQMGIDGWLYIAVGDYGFLNATGTDGRQISNRGGGIVRVRPDGTGQDQGVRYARLTLDRASQELVGLVVVRAERALLFGEESRLRLRLRRLPDGRWVPHVTRFRALVHVPFRTPRQFRTVSAYSNYVP